MRCERCGDASHEVNRSRLLRAWVCLRCYQHGTVLTWRVARALTGQPQSRSDIARAVERNPKDGAVGRALGRLVTVGLATRTPAGWQKAATAQPVSD